MNEFDPTVIKELKYYVYRLIDPRSGETFYVGKGKGNRVFSHAKDDVDGDDLSDKLSIVRDIKNSGFEVQHVIHRHGMDEDTAFEVEAALIDAYPGLTNVSCGFGSNDFGAMHAKEIQNKYLAETAVFHHKALLISVNKSALESSLYESTRFAWRLSCEKAEKAEVILPTVQGVIVGAYVADKWLPATSENFPLKQTIEGRYGFIGKEASVEIIQMYKGKKLPERYRKRGASNPIKYTYP